MTTLMNDANNAGTLLPCPFCGGGADFVRKGTARQSCVVACLDCGVRLETGEVWTSGQAWNERAALSTPKREAMALESRLEQVAKVMRSARAKNIPMEVWADDLKAVEDAILAVRLDEAAIRKDEREKCAAIATSHADKWESSASNANGDVDFNFISKSARHSIADALNGIAYEFASAIRNGGKQP